MKTALAAILLLPLISLDMTAQAARQPAQSRPPQAGPQAGDPNVNAILTDLQRLTQTTNSDLGKLRIERWKTDNSEKQQMQQIAESLQKNITQAVPTLISEVQANPGSVATAFKLYHNLNVVYEFLISLSESAGAYGRKEEYDPLAADANALDKDRQRLSDYINQTAVTMEMELKKATAPKPTSAQTTTTPNKVVIDDTAQTQTKKKKTVKKKTTPPPATNPPPSQ